MAAKFQARHYEFLADWLGSLGGPLMDAAAVSLADRLAKDNPSFQRKRFIDSVHDALHLGPVRYAGSTTPTEDL